MTQFKEYLGEMQRLDELLSKDHPASKWIHDFVKSDNPRFAGKSKKERIKMALGAYYAKQHEDVEVDQEVEQIEEADLEESAAKFTATVAKAEAAFKKGNEKLGRHHLTNARSTMFAMKTTESPKITANGSYAKYKELHDRYGHMREDVEQSDTLLEYPSDLAKMKKADSYKVGDKIWTKVGGKWHKGHITTPLNKAGNHGVKFQHNGQTHSYVSSPDQLRLHVEGVVEEVEIEEAVKLGTKVKIHAPGKDYHEKVGYVGEIRHGLFKGAPKTYTVDYDHNSETGYFKSIQLDKKQVKLHKEEVEIEEAADWELKKIHGEYKHLKSLSTADVHKKHKSMYRVTSSYKPAEVGGKQGMIDDIMHARHGQKRMDAYHALSKKQKDALSEESDCSTTERSQTFKQKSIWNAKNLKKALEVAKQDEPEKAE